MSYCGLPVTREELKRLHLLEYVSLDSIEGVLSACTVMELKPEEVLIASGQPNHNLYLLLSGRVRVHLISPDGPPLVYLHPGESVGEMSIIDHSPTSAYVIADTACRMLVMREEIVWSIMRASHEAALSLLLTITKRLRHANGVICEGIEFDREFHHYGTVDPLTGLYNRYWLNNSLDRHMSRCSIDRHPFSIILIDIDRFKEFNDRYGHLCGDKALRAVCRAFLENLRITEMAARYGGDEFVILLPDLDIGKARIVAERLRRAVEDVSIVLSDGRTLPPPTISLGIAQAEPEQTPEALLTSADAALYRAKGRGRNCCSE